MEFNLEEKQLCSVFKQYRNTINVYTEDQKRDKKFYVTILKRLLEGTGVTIKDVTPLGSCRQVMDACAADKSTYPKLYIVDGDIHLMSTPKQQQNHLFILDRYCIENYVVDQNSVYSVYNELDDEHSETEIQARINYQTMINSAIDPFVDLFRHFAVAHRKTNMFTLKNYSQVCDGNGSISPTKISNEKQEIKKRAVDSALVLNTEFDKELLSVESSYPSTEENFFKYVSGKDYIIPYVTDFCSTKLEKKFGLSKENWKYQFAKFFDIATLDSLKNAIIQEVKS